MVRLVLALAVLLTDARMGDASRHPSSKKTKGIGNGDQCDPIGYQVPDDSGVFRGCIDECGENLRFVENENNCTDHEKYVNWEEQGGEPGSDGKDGKDGMDGKDGAKGERGPRGESGPNIVCEGEWEGPLGFGNIGEDEYNLACPAGTVATGFAAQVCACSDDGYDRMALRCSNVMDGMNIMTGDSVKAYSATTTTAMVGSFSKNDNKIEISDCPKGSVMTGLMVESCSDSGLITAIRGECTKPKTSDYPSGDGQTEKIESFSGKCKDGLEKDSTSCSKNKAITGIEGTTGGFSGCDRLASINIMCC